MALYCGIDLHANNCYVAVLDEERRSVVCRRVPNELLEVIGLLAPYGEDLVRIGVESTFNWYWLVDGLRDAGFDVRLMNTNKADHFRDLKFRDDRHDARWIALLLALDIFPEAHIVPKHERRVRDLLRRRMLLKQVRTSLVLSVVSTHSRHTGRRGAKPLLEELTHDAAIKAVGDPLVALSMSSLFPVIRELDRQVTVLEKKAQEESKPRPEFALLQTVTGIGTILSMVVLYETASIQRFSKVGNYVSYCRLASTSHVSNGKRKGKGNRKNGNRYLSWAYSEAAFLAARYERRARRYVNRKLSTSHPMVAWRALANKMARACYWVLRDNVPFDPKRAF